SGTSESFTFTRNVAAGNLLALYVGWGATTSAVSSVSCGSDTPIAVDSNAQAGVGAARTYYVKNATGGATTCTVTWTADPGFGGFVGHEVSGADTSAPLDQHAIAYTIISPARTAAVTSRSLLATPARQ